MLESWDIHYVTYLTHSIFLPSPRIDTPKSLLCSNRWHSWPQWDSRPSMSVVMRIMPKWNPAANGREVSTTIERTTKKCLIITFTKTVQRALTRTRIQWTSIVGPVVIFCMSTGHHGNLLKNVFCITRILELRSNFRLDIDLGYVTSHPPVVRLVTGWSYKLSAPRISYPAEYASIAGNVNIADICRPLRGN